MVESECVKKKVREFAMEEVCDGAGLNYLQVDENLNITVSHFTD